MTAYSLRDYLLEHYLDYIQTIAKNGCAPEGVPGMIDYDDTSLLYDTFVNDIWLTVRTIAINLGEKLLPFVASVYGDNIEDNTTFKTCMLFLAVQDICSQIMLETEEGSE